MMTNDRGELIPDTIYLTPIAPGTLPRVHLAPSSPNDVEYVRASDLREQLALLAEHGICESQPGPYNNACRNIAAAIRNSDN